MTSDGGGNPHFLTVESWEAAAAELAFAPMEPRRTLGHELQIAHIHVRDHRMRELSIIDRSFAAHYGAFVVTQQAAADDVTARRLALDRPDGLDPQPATVCGLEARTCALGPEVPPDDVDGRSAATVAWADGTIFHLVASAELDVTELLDIAASIYG